MYLEMLYSKYGTGFEKSSAALVGNMLRRLGSGMANPNLHRRITNQLRSTGFSTHRLGNILRNHPKARLGFNSGAVSGLGTGALAGATGYGLYRSSSGPKQDAADSQPSNPETNIPDLHKRVLDFSKHMLITNPTQGSSFNSTGY